MRPNFFVNTPDILHEFLQYGGPAAFKLRAVLARRCRRPGACTPDTSCASTSPCGREARSTSTTRSTSTGRATGTRRPSRPHPRAVPDARSTGSAAQHPALHYLRNMTFHRADDDNSWSTAGASRAPHARRDRRHPDRRRQHGPARRAGDDRPPGHARAGHGLGGRVRGARPAQRGQSTAGGSTTTSGSTRTTTPPTCSTFARSGEEDSRVPGLDLAGPGLKHDPNWYRKAVFYEVLVRGFADSNGSGSGDFTGLISKLDYLQWLGVDCLWLPPFYASPLRDGGYDISDYCAVLPEFGTLPDFTELVAAGARPRHPGHHRPRRSTTPATSTRGSRRAASDPDGPYGDFYVWTDDHEQYADARIIFVDTETSPTGPSTPSAGSTSGTASSATSPTSTSTTPPCRTRSSTSCGSGWTSASTASGSTRSRTCSRGRAPTARTCRRPTNSSASCAGWSTRATRAGSSRRGQPVAEGVVEYFGTEDGAGMPHGLPLPGHAAALLRAARGEGGADHRDHERHAGHPRRRAVGHVPAQPRRADARDGHRPRSAPRCTAGTRRTRACAPTSASGAGWRRCWTTPAPRSSSSTPCCCPCPAARSCTTATRSAWATTSGSTTATPSARRCSGPRTATPGSPRADPGKLYLPVIQSLVYHYASVNVEAQIADAASSLLHWTRACSPSARQHPVFGLGRFVPVRGRQPARAGVPAGAAPGEVPGEPRRDRALREQPLPRAAGHDRSTCPEHCGATLEDLFGGIGLPRRARRRQLRMTMGSRDFFWLRRLGRPDSRG